MSKRVAVGVVVLALAWAVPAVAQEGKNNDKFITGDVLLGFAGTLLPPDVKCAGGQPSGLTFPHCTTGTNRILTRNEVQLWKTDSPSPSVAAFVSSDQIQFVVNCTLNRAYRGVCWGTFQWDVVGGGRWEGTWTSPVMDLMTYESKMTMVGFGTGGAIDGKQIKFEGGSEPYDWYIGGKIRIQ